VGAESIRSVATIPAPALRRDTDGTEADETATTHPSPPESC
jgi:hypothetical protein